MSTECLSFNLTQYKSFRSLQLQFSKVKDENVQIKAKLNALEQLYRNEKISVHNKIQQLAKKDKKIAFSKAQIEKELHEIIQSITEMNFEFNKIEKNGLDLGFQQMNKATERMGLTQSQKAKQKITAISKFVINLINQSNQQAFQYQKQLDLLKQENKIYKKKQKDFREQIEYLQEELAKTQQNADFLQNQLSQTKRQYVDYKLKFYSPPNLDSLEETNNKNSEIIEDNSFATDLLNFQKELLQKIFNRFLSLLKNPAINQKLNDIYNSYESICKLFRQKLQIEYDLEDLEREYKRQKNSKVSQNLLIELRKQIQEFRNQLQKQKDELSKEQNILEQEFLELKAIENEEKRVKTYSLEVEKKLKEIKSYNQTKRSTWDNGQYQQNRIKFKPTETAEELMKEVVRKDRQNIEKILKQTRNSFLKQATM